VPATKTDECFDTFKASDFTHQKPSWIAIEAFTEITSLPIENHMYIFKKHLQHWLDRLTHKTAPPNPTHISTRPEHPTGCHDITHQAAMIGVAYRLSYTALERVHDVKSEETLPFADQFATLISTKSRQL
jgi:hypothetical protein